MKKSIIQESKEVKFKGDIFNNVKNDLKKLMKSIDTQKKYSSKLSEHGNFNYNFERLSCYVMGTNLNDLKSKIKTTEVVWSRNFIYSYLRENTTLTLKDIGLRYNRKHCTVMWGLKKHEDLKIDKVYIALFNEFTRLINEK